MLFLLCIRLEKTTSTSVIILQISFRRGSPWFRVLTPAVLRSSSSMRTTTLMVLVLVPGSRRRRCSKLIAIFNYPFTIVPDNSGPSSCRCLLVSSVLISEIHQNPWNQK